MRFLLTFLFLFYALCSKAQYIDTGILTANDGLLSNDVKTLMVDSQGYLWLGSRAGLSVKKGTKFKPSEQAVKHKFNNIFDMLEDGNHGKWIAGYGQGVLYFNEDDTKLINESSGLVSNLARTLFCHNEKVYIGTQSGISIISTRDFSIINPKFTQHSDYLFSLTSFFSVNQKKYMPQRLTTEFMK